jgi:biotin carboxylase
MTRHLFVIGPDAFNQRRLERIDIGEPFAVHPLLYEHEIKDQASFDFDALLETARARLSARKVPVDALVAWWDFPTSTLLTVLNAELGKPHPPLAAILACEHKYWNRLVQQRAVPECVPAFHAVDPFAADAAERTFDWPVWIKPVKAFSSNLGFRCDGPEDYRHAIRQTRAEIGRMGQPFDRALRLADLPAEVQGIGGHHCVVEGIVQGRQCTVEGYVQNGEVVPYAIIDAVNYPGTSSFHHYQYPSSLPERTKRRVRDQVVRLVRQVGLDDCAFNVEFMWEAERDLLWLVEINPRLSQSHADIFEKVHGVPHFQIPVEIALGRPVRWAADAGAYACAGKFFLRTFADGTVTRAPTSQELARLQADFPGVDIEPAAAEGTRLSAMYDQDSYSYALAEIYIAASDGQTLHDTYAEVARRLPFELDGQPVTAG